MWMYTIYLFFVWEFGGTQVQNSGTNFTSGQIQTFTRFCPVTKPSGRIQDSTEWGRLPELSRTSLAVQYAFVKAQVTRDIKNLNPVLASQDDHAETRNMHYYTTQAARLILRYKLYNIYIYSCTYNIYILSTVACPNVAELSCTNDAQSERRASECISLDCNTPCAPTPKRRGLAGTMLAKPRLPPIWYPWGTARGAIYALIHPDSTWFYQTVFSILDAISPWGKCIDEVFPWTD